MRSMQPHSAVQPPKPMQPPQPVQPPQPMQPMQGAGPVLAVAFVCPWCRAPIGPPPADGGPPHERACGSCSKKFLFVAGQAGDAQVMPYHPNEHRAGYKVKLPGFFLMKQVELEPQGFAWGDLDPLVGVARMGSTRVQYPQVVSFSAWRSVNVARLLASVLIGGSITLMFLSLALSDAWPLLLLGLPVALLTGIGVYRSFRPGLVRMRLVHPQGEQEWTLRRTTRREEPFVLEATRRISQRAAERLP